MKDVYWTIGQYDLVALLEAPDDETITAFGLSTGVGRQSAHRNPARFHADENGRNPEQARLSTMVQADWRRPSVIKLKCECR
jgi:hypothetical protein